ncbi:MAG: hypothetical protein DWI21_13440 [Planctomycetota bacterium]|nr:MAG: hypothetical protein DWI21_13440 [Planctomycetota bacterium]
MIRGSNDAASWSIQISVHWHSDCDLLTPTGRESASSDGMVPLRQSLSLARFGNPDAQKDPIHDHPVEDQESGSRTDRIANGRLPQKIGGASSMLPLLSRWTVTAGPFGERRSSSLGCVSVRNHTQSPSPH